MQHQEMQQQLACSHHRCGAFTATHVVSVGDRRWYVHAEIGEDETTYLFTTSEWDGQKHASWLMRDGVLFQHGKAVDATIVNFNDCAEAAADGWDEGSPGRDARFVD